jgi:hypothetical protein
MIINVGKITREIIADTLGSTTRSLEETDPMTEGERKSINVRTLGNRIKAIIQKKVPTITELEVTVSSTGIVTISGNVRSENDKALIEQQVRALPEVQDVVNNIKIVQSFKEHE